eukprot:TRINITY_DN12119_c0_g1_i5.p1 TRINITY_DN12119_c0_g1~~TRINITY_DN12119_c0_g1_i5.p1  ORF type:complete len:857 (+),score=222.22 TRINITY_DN12119_c0_g1_i5:260-2830(+)
MDVRMTLLPSKSPLFRAKQITVLIMLALRGAEFFINTASDWGVHWEIHLSFVCGSWLTCLAVLMAERRAGVTEHGTGVRIFSGVVVLIQSVSLRMVVMLNSQNYISNTRMTLYAVSLGMCLLFAVAVNFLQEKTVNQTRCGETRAQYSTIELTNDSGETEEWKLNRLEEESIAEKRKWYSDVDKELVLRILWFGRPEMCKLIWATVLTIVATLLGMMKNLVFGFLVNEILESANKSEATDLLHKYVLFLVGCYVVEMIIGGTGSALLAVCGERIAVRLRNVVYQAILSQDIGFFDVTSSGELVNRITTDTTMVTGVIMGNMTSWIVPLLNGVIGYIAIFIISYRMTLVMVSFTPALLAGMYVMGKVMQVLTTKDLDALAKSNATSVEGVDNARTIRAFGTEGFESYRYEKDLNVSYDVCILKAWISGFMGALFGLISNAMSLVAMWYGATLVIEGKLKLGYLLTFQMFCGQALGATSAIMGVFPEFASAVAASKRIFELLDRERDVRFSGGKRVVQDYKSDKILGRVELRNVHFSYPARPHVPVLKAVSLVIEAGTMNAFVGPSGSGKSTVVNLIANFYAISGGSLTLDHMEVANLDPILYRRMIGYVAQQPVLFSTTVRENVAYGIQATQVQIEWACRQANAYDFIVNDLDKGFDSECGPGGVTLSGGQKQRIAIARAVLRNPCLLLLDEATSALDSESERLVQEALDALMKNRTSVVIAHRLSTVRHADQIHVIKGGSVVESGTHDELIAVPGSEYATLARRQFGLKMDDGPDPDAEQILEEASADFGEAFDTLKPMFEGAPTEVKDTLEVLKTSYLKLVQLQQAQQQPSDTEAVPEGTELKADEEPDDHGEDI